ncbi:HAMP domain-containing histidine kinase, partial [bacterium]|nr:HAMP domain-containing histidine kinase [bacterium]
SAGIAHEINNPLGVVLMYAHLLLEDSEPDSEDREDLQMIADYADRAKKIVSGLLNFARQHEVDLKPVNVPKLIQEHLRSMQIQSAITVRIDDKMVDPVADIDTDQMIQVITNLVSNGVTAMPDGGDLIVLLSGNDDEIKIAISDTGTGIPKDIVSKVFDPFFTTKKAGKGTGLGLAITYGIVKMHRGQVTVISNVNPEDGPTGTTFTVTVPRMSIR